MSNEYIEVVKKWLADKTSVSSKELRANARAAAHAHARAADAADAAAAAAHAHARAADYWVERHEEMTDE